MQDLNFYLTDELFFVAEINNKIVGLIFGEVLKGAGCLLWMLAVDSIYRKHDIGTKLLTYYETVCKERGIEWIFLCAPDSAKRFYQKQNYSMGKKALFEGIKYLGTKDSERK